jgi:hypothetical protein
VTDQERTERTYRLERWRAVSSGILETAGNTFLLVIALKWFQAGAIAKALIAGGTSFGLLVTPLVVTWVTRRGLSPTAAAFRFLMTSAVSFLVVALVPWLPLFVVGSVVGMAAVSAVVPRLTHLYQHNYPAAGRGRLFSRTVMIRILTAAIFAKLGGMYLAGDMARFRWLLLVFALASAFAAVQLRRCPSVPLDTVFRNTLIAWMLMGFGNLMMIPLRVEYLGHERYGLRLSADEIALYTAVVPNLARLVVSPVWGWLFDRMNFFALRVTLNVGFMVGILAFFSSETPAGWVLGAVVHGISVAGGDVAWSLWVTKFARPERVADYMAVHTCFTGFRGVLAPVAAFYLAGWLALPTLGWISAGLIGCACLLLIPEIIGARAARSAPALVEEVSD